MDHGQEACSGLRKKKSNSARTRRVQSMKSHLRKCSQIHRECAQRAPEEGTNPRSGRSGRCKQQSTIQTAAWTPCTTWHQPSPKMAGSSTPGKKGHHTSWKLDLHTQTTDNVTFTRLSPVLFNVYTRGLAHLNNGLSQVLTIADDMLIYKTVSDTYTAVAIVLKQL